MCENFVFWRGQWKAWRSLEGVSNNCSFSWLLVPERKYHFWVACYAMGLPMPCDCLREPSGDEGLFVIMWPFPNILEHFLFFAWFVGSAWLPRAVFFVCFLVARLKIGDLCF